ncbi:MAG: hypothetical protein ACJ75B_20140 [Flavisolibacter sp.]|jgi:hypothetical protein
MLLNLSRSFHFQRNQRSYHIQYIFTNESLEGSKSGDVCLALRVGVDSLEDKTFKLNQPKSTLYLSNEAIEKLIEDAAVSCSLPQK